MKIEQLEEQLNKIEGFMSIQADDRQNEEFEDDCFIHIIRNGYKIAFYNGQEENCFGEKDVKRFAKLVDKIFGTKSRKTKRSKDYGVHMTHCFQGEYEHSCKYGEDNVCPAYKPYTKPTTISFEEAQKDISSLLSSLADACWNSGNMDAIRKKYHLDE